MNALARGTKITVMVVVTVAAIVGLMLVGVQAILRSTIQVERELAEPFLAIGDDPRLEQNYGTLFPNGLGAGMGSVTVVYESDDPEVTIDAIHEVMLAQGWDRSQPDGSEWHSGGGELGHRWGMIRIEGAEVELFIGRIEG